jgi:hypothetical protein
VTASFSKENTPRCPNWQAASFREAAARFYIEPQSPGTKKDGDGSAAGLYSIAP